jgi:glycosyltransferase involved in cell wall biosynthesis
MRILIALPGLHKYNRGAEVAFISVARELSRLGEKVTLMGSGIHRRDEPYRFVTCASVPRERFERLPSVPIFRNEYAYEDFTFAFGLLRRYRPKDFDITVTCNYPFTNWVLRRRAKHSDRPRHVFVTENGDWAPQSTSAEYRFFSCDGLICTNPDFFERNKKRWPSRLIPNGIDLDRFRPGTPDRSQFGLQDGSLVVLMVSALMPSKRVTDGIEAVSRIPGAHLVVAGDGPLRDEVDQLARNLLDGRFSRLTVPSSEMPALYRCADVFLHLSKEESFGNVFLEALACGLPVVAHDTSRVRWIVGSEEYLVDTSNLSAVSDAISTAYDSRSIERTSKRYAAAARFSWDRVASMYRDFFADILTGVGSRAKSDYSELPSHTESSQ